MNPFDLRGPEFLLFYLAFGAAILIVVAMIRRATEADGSTGVVLDDYLAIAYLRGGRNEALRVATLNLINRGLLEVSPDGTVQTPSGKTAPNVAKTLERALLHTFRKPAAASS